LGEQDRANVLNKLPQGLQAKAKSDLHEIWMAECRVDARAGFRSFPGELRSQYPKATEGLAKDRDPLLTFYDFPAEHWQHIRTTNPVNRLSRPCGGGSPRRVVVSGARHPAVVFKLTRTAEQKWRTLKGTRCWPTWSKA